MAGGYNSTGNTDTTEIFKKGDPSWTFVGALPNARNGFRATTVNNIVYVLGKEGRGLKIITHNSTF